MAKITRILVPIDFSETSDNAISKAIEFVKALKAELLLIHVVEHHSYQFLLVPELQTVPESPIREIEKAVEKKMDSLQSDIREEHGIIPEVYITTGNMHAEIIEFSKKKKIDLIIMGTHGRSGYRELLGSNAQRIVTLSTIPVLTIQMKANSPGFKNILLPIDNSLHSREKVNIAILIAEAFHANALILGLPNSDDVKDIEIFKVKTNSVREILDEHKVPNKVTITKGEGVAKTAMDYAEKNSCDLIIINTGHESKLTGIFLGAFAQQIVNHSKIPVLSYRHVPGSYTVDAPGYGV
jgi:nucleotide-binding universal stress UspA family protein